MTFKIGDAVKIQKPQTSHEALAKQAEETKLNFSKKGKAINQESIDKWAKPKYVAEIGKVVGQILGPSSADGSEKLLMVVAVKVGGGRPRLRHIDPDGLVAA